MKIKFFRVIDRVIGAVLIVLLWLLMLFFPKHREKPKEILIIKLWAIGESIVTLPMITALKKAYPRSKITVLCRDRVRQVFEGNKDISEIISAEPFSLLALLPKFRHFDLAIDCEPYLNESTLLSRYLSKRTIGFSHGLRSLLYTDSVRYNDEQHIVLTYLDILEKLDIKPKTPRHLVPMATRKADQNAVNAIFKENGVKKKDRIVCINPGAAESAKGRMWPAQKFAKTADALVKEFLVKIVILGAKSERKDAEEVAEAMEYRPINLAGETSLKELAALLKRSSLTISNDTGTMHLSAAMGTPTIGLFGPNTPVRWAPYGPGNESVYKPVRSKPCINVHKGEVPDCRNHQHMSLISVGDVVKKARRMLYARRH